MRSRGYRPDRLWLRIIRGREGERTCLTAGYDGYCAEINCWSTSDCPREDHTLPSMCVDIGGGSTACLMDCTWGDDLCDFNPGTCLDTYDVDGDLAAVCALGNHDVP